MSIISHLVKTCSTQEVAALQARFARDYNVEQIYIPDTRLSGMAYCCHWHTMQPHITDDFGLAVALDEDMRAQLRVMISCNCND